MTAWARIDIADVRWDDGPKRATMLMTTVDGRRLCAANVDREATDFKALVAACSPGSHARVRLEGDLITGVGFLNPRMHPLTGDILSTLGYDVEAAKRWATGPLIWSPPVRAADAEGASIDDGLLEASTVEMTFVLTAGYVTLGHTLPETVLTAAVGRALRTVVSLPGLDELALPILEVKTISWGSAFRVVPDNGEEPLPDEAQS